MKIYRYSSEKEIVSVALGFRSDSSKRERQVCYALKRPGGRTPYNGLYREDSARKGYLFQASGVGISLVEIYKRVGKFVIWVCERAQKG